MIDQQVLVLQQWTEPAEGVQPRGDIGAGTVYQTTTETQDVALKVDGAGTEFVGFCRTNGSAAEIYRVTPQGIPSLLGTVTPPPNAGVYSVALSGSGTSLVIAVTGHYFTEKPRINFIGIAAFNGIFVPNLQTTGEGPGAFTGAIVPPATTPPPALTAADVVNALRDAIGGDTLRHAWGPFIQGAAMAAIVDAFKSKGDAAVYQGVSNMVYAATLNALRAYFGKPAVSDTARDITETAGTGYPAQSDPAEDPTTAEQKEQLRQELAALKARFAHDNHSDPVMVDEPDVPAGVDADTVHNRDWPPVAVDDEEMDALQRAFDAGVTYTGKDQKIPPKSDAPTEDHTP